MAFKQNTTPTKVTYFKHFPHYFIRPYDAQLHFNQSEFLEKLTPRNCEWMMRPKIALSEAAQALRENWDIIKDAEVVDSRIRDNILNIMTPIADSLLNVDTKQKSTQATETDIYNILNACFQEPQLDASLANWMQQSAALYVFIAQLRAMRTVLANPQQYASKLMNDSPEAVQFKTAKTVPAMQQMLNTMCTTVQLQTLSSTATGTHGQLAGQLINPNSQSQTLVAPPLPLLTGLCQPTTLPPATATATATQVNLPSLPPDIPSTSSTAQANLAATQQQEQQPVQPPPQVNDQFMDMMLQLQAQIQALQQQAAMKASRDQEQEEEEQTAKRKKTKKCTTQESKETGGQTIIIKEEEEQPSGKRKRRNKEKAPEQSKQNEEIQQPPMLIRNDQQSQSSSTTTIAACEIDDPTPKKKKAKKTKKSK